MDARMMEASCANCQHFRNEACALGVTLAPGEKLCDEYEITPEFQEKLVSAFMKENPMEVPVPLLARAQREKLQEQQSRQPRKGFRQKKRRK